MDFSTHFTTLAHAYLIEGRHDDAEASLLDILEREHLVAVKGNQDFWHRRYVSFAIEDAREVKSLASNRKASEGKRIFIISAENITREASNALLKTLEEPGEGTHFFIILPSLRRVLPTILSRVRVVKHSSDEIKGNARESVTAEKSILNVEEFLEATPGERLKIVKEMLSLVEKEELTKSECRIFIESVLRTKRAQQKDASKIPQDLSKQATILSYAEDQSASLKMVLEYLSLTI